MTDADAIARRRWLAITLARVAGTAGAVLGLVLIGRADEWQPKLVGGALMLSALFMIATVPRALAHRWRTPPE